ncbi:Nudix family hydrolase [Xenophilus sp.]|uniref:Nudix family hydrolase n=1 Tax=Xenophilus sp. TaxID=1873499 RepID=UPI0037DD82B7
MGRLYMGMDDPSPAIEVLAGVITDARGRILLARRTEGRDLAGLWEFPGGKREPGESAEATLARELEEELGIRVEIGAPLITVPHRYPHKRLRLDVRHISAWEGTLKGLDGQALAWVPARKLGSYAMPGADRPVVAALLQPDRYLVTPDATGEPAGWLAALERALVHGGATRVQLRAPVASENPEQWRALAREAAAVCRRHDAQALVNADIKLARDLRIGVHLKASQLAGMAQRPLPATLPVGASCHDAADLRHAERLHCDFAVVGPIRPTPSHPGAPGIGWEAFEALREDCTIPLYAIGGLGPADLAEARLHGAQGIAGIRGLWGARPG